MRTMAGLAALSMGAFLMAPAAAEPPNATQKSGEIRGRVTWCGGAPVVEGIAQLPGKSFQARLSPGGEFQMYWVPVGRHSVSIDVPGRAPLAVEDVLVTDRRITQLAAVSLCRDGDGDAATEDVDCNDNNPSVHPGAAEACDGQDNDCDGVVDEGCLTCTDADQDGFYAQAGCATAVDCDDSRATTRPGAIETCDAVDNDCDGTADEGFDLQTNPSHCGACGNVCTARLDFPATCSAGTCLLPPPSPEVCDYEDNDLDGRIDEGFPVGHACYCGEGQTGSMDCDGAGGITCVC